MSGHSGFTGEDGASIMWWQHSPSPTTSEVHVDPSLCTTIEFEVLTWHVGLIPIWFVLGLLQCAMQADDPWYIAYEDESTQWSSQRMDLEEMVANLGDELARKNLLIFELKCTIEE